MSDRVLTNALSRQSALIESLAALVACPSVGADPAMAGGMEEARHLIETRLDSMGFRNRQRLSAADQAGQPAIYADRIDAPGCACPASENRGDAPRRRRPSPHA